jgi:hypothetical protein
MTMWHVISDTNPWFSTKRYGYGAGLPIRWQGWALLLSYIGAMAGLGLLAERTRGMALAGLVATMLVLTVVLVVIVRARTDGEWHWRWGGDE